MTSQIIVTSSSLDDTKAIVNLVLDGLTSNHSKRAYEKALNDFLQWYQEQGKPGLNKAIVQHYKVVLQERRLAPASINQRMSAIRKLAQEAADNGLLDQAIANGISKVKGVKQQGIHVGNWLTRDQAQALINSPEMTTIKGNRDRAILAVMIGAGLRRSELASLDFQDIQQREGRWVIVDLLGKGNRVRTVPVPNWAKAAVDAWSKMANIKSGRVFRRVNKGGRLTGDSLTAQAIRNVVNQYSEKNGFQVAAHDLRRTFAKLAHKGGSGIDQIQLSLGHASIRTTEIYLGVTQNLTDAPCDRLGIRLFS